MLGGLFSAPLNKVAEFAPYLGINYRNGDFGTSDWMKSNGIIGEADNSALSGKLGGLMGTTAAMGIMGKNFDHKAALKALAMSMMADQATTMFKSYFGPQQ